MKLTVTLGASSEASFDIELFETKFVDKWLSEFRWCLDNCSFVQHEAFATLLTLEQSAERLKQSCDTINRYLPGMLDLRDDPLSEPQEYFNYLHSKFEALNGEFDRPSRLFSIANAELRSAIRDLNFFVHRCETRREPRSCLYMSFDKDRYRRRPMEVEDYDHAEFVLPAGTLMTHYMELGKDFEDLFEDGLGLDYPGFRNLHYFGGEAAVTLKEFNLFERPGLKQWLQNQGLDPYNKALGHGRIALGRVIDLDRTRTLIDKHRHLNKIIVKE